MVPKPWGLGLRLQALLLFGIAVVPFSKAEIYMKTRVAATAGFALAVLSIGPLTSCSRSQNLQSTESTQTVRASTSEQAPQRNPDRNAYFGEEHIHTSWSVDAWLMGNRLTGPDDAFKYAQGQDHQASHGLRHQDRYAHGLHGCDRPLGIRRSYQGGKHARLLRE